jgi:transposase-like protein
MGEKLTSITEEPIQEQAEKPTIKIICAWCEKDMGTKEAGVEPEGAVTHSICPGCLKKFVLDKKKNK